MRQDALEVFFCDKISFKKYSTQKAAVLEQVTKLRKKQKRSKVWRKLQSDYPFEPPSKKARHSPGHVDSSSSGPSDMSIDGSNDNGSDVCTENSLSSGGQVQLPKVEGWVQFFDKQIQYTIQSGKVFLPVIDIPLVKNYVDKKGILNCTKSCKHLVWIPQLISLCSEWEKIIIDLCQWSLCCIFCKTGTSETNLRDSNCLQNVLLIWRGLLFMIYRTPW